MNMKVGLEKFDNAANGITKGFKVLALSIRNPNEAQKILNQISDLFQEYNEAVGFLLEELIKREK